MAKNDLMDRVVNLAKRRGLVFPSSEIYGGFRSTWDYGPLGVLLKRNVKDAWWRSHGAAARRRRRPRRRHPHGAEGVGGERARRHLHRPARRLPQLQGALPRRRAARLGRVSELRHEGHLHRGAPVQPDVQDLRRPGGRRRLGRVPASGDRAGHLRQLPQRADDDAQEAAVRHRADRQVVPQRDHARQLRLPHPRVRADGDGVLRAARGRREWYEYWCQERFRWYTDLGIPEDQLRLRPHATEELSHYSAGTSDVEFLYPWGWGELEGIANRTDYDLTQHSKFSGQDLTTTTRSTTAGTSRT